jgi:SH3 domain protein
MDGDMKKRLCLVLVVFSILTLSAQMAIAAKTAYIHDLCQVNMRSGPGTNFRVTATLTSGFVVEVLGQKNDWSKVSFLKEDDQAIEGWILNRFLVDEPPWAEQATSLTSSLKEQLACAVEEKDQLSQKESELTLQLQSASDKLQQLELDYQSLQAGATDYLKLKEEYESAKIALVKAQDDVDTMGREIENLKLSLKIRWFIAGAVVLICGWAIGIVMGRYQRKRRTNFRV